MEVSLSLRAMAIIALLSFVQAKPQDNHIPCRSGTCGTNAVCTITAGRSVCSCLPGHSGDPLYRCVKLECTENSDCSLQLACRDTHCVSPCEGTCGVGAECRVQNHIPVCSCPAGSVGDPFSQCRQRNPVELCTPSPCGANTDCYVNNDRATCKCKPGFFGSPLTGCKHECESDYDCGPSQSCSAFKCVNPCDQCGVNARCSSVQNHRPVCVCPENYIGNPYTACNPECSSHHECPSHKPACYNNKCTNPCEGSCGVGANCELRNGLTPVCSCPRDMTGDPFVRCRPFEKADLCNPNPCGVNAQCQPGYDNTNRERPVCTCLPGFVGNGVTGCSPGECTTDDGCPDNKACIDYNCRDPCIGQCGVNAICSGRRHIAVCTCPDNHTGDALTQCKQKARAYYGRRFNYYY